MSEKNTLRTRLVNKHDIEANWLKATNFTPLQGELIVYDIDENYNYERIKMGDGVTNVNELPFISSQVDWNQNDENAPDYVKNRTHWEEETEVDLLSETEFEQNEYNVWGTTVKPNAYPEIGKTYTITFNGAKLDLVAQDIDDIDGMVGFIHTDAEPQFMLGFLPDDRLEDFGDFYVAVDTTAASVNVSVRGIGTVTHKIDPKFMHETVIMAERPELTSEVVILPETELAVDEVIEGNGVYALLTPSENAPTAGAKCKLMWGGTEYTNTAVDVSAIMGVPAFLLGNTALVAEDGMSLDNPNADAPYCVTLVPDGMPLGESGDVAYGMMMSMGITPEPPVLSIVQTEGGATPQQLVMDKDGNIKWEDRTHWVEPALVDILPETTYTDDASIEAGLATPLSHALVAGEVYQVNYNGTIYKCTCISVTESGITIPVLGNTEMMNLPGGNPDAPFVFMEIPRGIPDAPENMYWQLLPTDESGEVLPLTFGIKYEGEIIHKIDNKFLDITPSNWNALPGTPGYIENRTHYCDHIVMTYDPAKLAGVDTLAVDFGSNPITFYKIGDYALDAAALKASSYTITTLSTGEQSTTAVTMAQDNNGISAGIAPAFFIYSIHDLAAASESGIVAPSTGTYIVVLSEEACAVTIDAGEILKKLDEKYLPDNAINTVNSVNGQTGDVMLTAADVGAVADTLNIENDPVGIGSLRTKTTYSKATGATAIALGLNTAATGDRSISSGCSYTLASVSISGDGGTTVYTCSYDVTTWGANSLSYQKTGKCVGIQKVEPTDDNKYLITLSETLSDDAILYGDKVYAVMQTVASGLASYAGGIGTVAYGNASHAEGYGTIVHGQCGFVIGQYNKDEDASGYYTYEIRSTETKILTSTYRVFAEEPVMDLFAGEIIYGEYETKSGADLAVGDYVTGASVVDTSLGVVYKYYDQLIQVVSEESSRKTFAVRRVCISHRARDRGTYTFMLGNGSSSKSRSNAHAVDWDGNAYFTGDVYVQGDGTTFEFDGKKKLATEEYVGTAIAALVDTAPETLNTLNELSAALGDDPNFATTVLNQLSNKVEKVEGKDLSTNDYTNEEKIKVSLAAAMYINNVEPADAAIGSFWYDTNEE